MNRPLLDEPAARWKGPALIEDLASFLRESGWIAVTEMYFPGWDSRVDVMAVKPHAFAMKDVRIYEVKVSRSDFWRDEGANKWRKYLDAAHRVYFACPAGVLTKDDMPREAGLIVRGPKGWQVVKAGRGHEPPGLTVDLILAVLSKVHSTDIEIRRLKERIVTDENEDLADRATRLGQQIRDRLRGRDSYELVEKARLVDQVLAVCAEVTGFRVDEMRDFSRLRQALSAVSHLVNNLDLCEQIGRVLGGLGSQFANIAESQAKLRSLLGKGAPE